MTDDSHIHLFEREFKDGSHIDAELEEYESLRKLAGINFALVIGYEGTERYKGNNSYILKLAASHSWIYPVSFIDPASKAASNEILDCRELGFSGCALYLSEKSEKLSDDVISAFNRMGERGAVLSVNADPFAIARFQDQFAQLSTCNILISHLGLPETESPRNPAQIKKRISPLLALAKLPNLFVKLSAFYAIDPVYPFIGARPYVRELLENFGASRLMWGSDYSPSTDYGTGGQIATIPEWIAEEMTESEYEGVAGLNLRSLLQR